MSVQTVKQLEQRRLLSWRCTSISFIKYHHIGAPRLAFLGAQENKDRPSRRGRTSIVLET